MLVQFLCPHPRVTAHLAQALEALLLGRARGEHPLPNGRRGLTRAGGRQLLVADGRHLDVNIYPVEERPGNLVAVVLDLQRRTAAIVFRIAVIPARICLPTSA